MDFSQDVDALKGNLSIPWALTNLEVDARRIPVLHLICVPSLTMSYCTYPGKAYQTLVASSCRLSHQLMSQIPLVSLDSEICVKIGHTWIQIICRGVGRLDVPTSWTLECLP